MAVTLVVNMDGDEDKKNKVLKLWKKRMNRVKQSGDYHFFMSMCEC